jgi:hypothetical protein
MLGLLFGSRSAGNFSRYSHSLSDSSSSLSTVFFMNYSSIFISLLPFSVESGGVPLDSLISLLSLIADDYLTSSCPSLILTAFLIILTLWCLLSFNPSCLDTALGWVATNKDACEWKYSCYLASFSIPLLSALD